MKLMLKVNLIFGNFLEKALVKMKKIFGLTYLGNPEEKNFGDYIKQSSPKYPISTRSRF
jgi:hypothetical protein